MPSEMRCFSGEEGIGSDGDKCCIRACSAAALNPGPKVMNKFLGWGLFVRTLVFHL